MSAHMSPTGFRNKPHTDNPYMSRDNTEGKIILSVLGDEDYHKEMPPELELKHYAQPWDIIWYGYMTGRWYHLVWSFPLLWVVTIQSLFTCLRQTQKGQKTSSGKQLALGKILIADMKITLYLSTLAIGINKLFGSWMSVFEEYYKHPEHPIKPMVEEWEMEYGR